MSKRLQQRIVFQPRAHDRLQRGVNKLVEAIRPTLGPQPRTVAIARHRTHHDQTPEILDNGGLIARRIIALPDRDEDMGAMLLRHLLWRLHEEVGDGTATAAVLFQSIFNQGLLYLAQGGNAMGLSRSLQEGLRLILDSLDLQPTIPEGKRQLAQIAESICHDPPLASLLGEVFDIIGEYGQLEVRKGRGRGLEREYIEGLYWSSKVFSRYMLAGDGPKLRVEMEEAVILISDLSINDPGELTPALRVAIDGGVKTMLVIAGTMSEDAASFLNAASQTPDKFRVVAVRTPGASIDLQIGALADLAVLTGGKPFLKATGDTLGDVELADLGRARQVWADANYFGVLGGKGNPRHLREHVRQLQSRFRRTKEREQRDQIQRRLGKLMGGAATLWVGGNTDLEITTRQEQAERTARAMRAALREGVLSGGGMALLNCQAALRPMAEQDYDPDVRAACRILHQALEIPLRTIINNSGGDEHAILAQLICAGPGFGYDGRSGEVVDLEKAGMFDVSGVVRAALHGAVTTAALALTTDVLVHHKRPNTSYTP